MTDTTSDRAIGRMEGKLDALTDSMTFERDRNDAFRRVVYDKLESIERSQLTTNQEMASVKSRLIDAEKVITEYKSLKSMGRGWLLCAALGGGSIAITLQEYIFAFFKGFKG